MAKTSRKMRKTSRNPSPQFDIRSIAERQLQLIDSELANELGSLNQLEASELQSIKQNYQEVRDFPEEFEDTKKMLAKEAALLNITRNRYETKRNEARSRAEQRRAEINLIAQSDVNVSEESLARAAKANADLLSAVNKARVRDLNSLKALPARRRAAVEEKYLEAKSAIQRDKKLGKLSDARAEVELAKAQQRKNAELDELASLDAAQAEFFAQLKSVEEGQLDIAEFRKQVEERNRPAEAELFVALSDIASKFRDRMQELNLAILQELAQPGSMAVQQRQSALLKELKAKVDYAALEAARRQDRIRVAEFLTPPTASDLIASASAKEFNYADLPALRAAINARIRVSKKDELPQEIVDALERISVQADQLKKRLAQRKKTTTDALNKVMSESRSRELSPEELAQVRDLVARMKAKKEKDDAADQEGLEKIEERAKLIELDIARWEVSRGGEGVYTPFSIELEYLSQAVPAARARLASLLSLPLDRQSSPPETQEERDAAISQSRAELNELKTRLAQASPKKFRLGEREERLTLALSGGRLIQLSPETEEALSLLLADIAAPAQTELFARGDEENGRLVQQRASEALARAHIAELEQKAALGKLVDQIDAGVEISEWENTVFDEAREIIFAELVKAQKLLVRLSRIAKEWRRARNHPDPSGEVEPISDEELGRALRSLGDEGRAVAAEFDASVRALKQRVYYFDENGDKRYKLDYLRDADGKPVYVGQPTKYAGRRGYAGPLSPTYMRARADDRSYARLKAAEDAITRRIELGEEGRVASGRARAPRSVRADPKEMFARLVVEYEKYTKSEKNMSLAVSQSDAYRFASRNAPRDRAAIERLVRDPRFKFQLPAWSSVIRGEGRIPPKIQGKISLEIGRPLVIGEEEWAREYKKKQPKKEPGRRRGGDPQVVSAIEAFSRAGAAEIERLAAEERIASLAEIDLAAAARDAAIAQKISETMSQTPRTVYYKDPIAAIEARQARSLEFEDDMSAREFLEKLAAAGVMWARGYLQKTSGTSIEGQRVLSSRATGTWKPITPSTAVWQQKDWIERAAAGDEQALKLIVQRAEAGERWAIKHLSQPTLPTEAQATLSRPPTATRPKPKTSRKPTKKTSR